MSSEILKLKEKVKELVSSIKGLSEYSEENQNTLLKTFDKNNIKKYIALDKGIKRRKIYVLNRVKSGNALYFTSSFLGLGIGYDGSKFQITNHTLFTFLTEHGILPEECKEYKKIKD